jgi:hypothetical protein
VPIVYIFSLTEGAVESLIEILRRHTKIDVVEEMFLGLTYALKIALVFLGRPNRNQVHFLP